MSERSIYLDNASTTKLDPRVVDAMLYVMREENGNPASRSHEYGWQAEKLVETARKNVADLINASPKEIVWTSGATESDNLALKGVAKFYQSKGKHIITCKTEHKAILDTARQLEREGYEVTYLDVDAQGYIDLTELERMLRDDTILVSIMHANNELGVVQDIAKIGQLTRSKGVLLHVDAAQSPGRLPIDVEAMQIDLLSLSAHKVYGPKGVGALYVRRKPRVRLEALIHGGGHERGMRSGTLPTHQIVGMGEAFKLAKENMLKDNARIKQLRDKLWLGIKDLEEVYLNGDLTGLPGHLNVSFNYVEGESLMMALKRLAVSSGSACTSASLEPSYVLRAIGRNDELAHSSIRFSIGRFNTEAEIDEAIELIRNSVNRLRQMSPLWEMYLEGIDLSKVEWQAH